MRWIQLSTPDGDLFVRRLKVSTIGHSYGYEEGIKVRDINVDGIIYLILDTPENMSKLFREVRKS